MLHEGRQPDSLVGGAARGLWLDTSDAVVLDGVHETRLCGEGGVVDKVEVKDLAESGGRRQPRSDRSVVTRQDPACSTVPQ